MQTVWLEALTTVSVILFFCPVHLSENRKKVKTKTHLQVHEKIKLKSKKNQSNNYEITKYKAESLKSSGDI